MTLAAHHYRTSAPINHGVRTSPLPGAMLQVCRHTTLHVAPSSTSRREVNPTLPGKYYHGTTKKFEAFKPGATHSNMQLGFGIHFTQDRDFAGRYGKLVTVRLSYTKMLDLTKLYHVERDPEMYRLAKEVARGTRWQVAVSDGAFIVNLDLASPQKALRILKAYGYDAVRYIAAVISTARPGYLTTHAKAESVIVLDPSQVEIVGNENPQRPARSQSTKDYYAIMGKGYARRFKWDYNKPMVKAMRRGKRAEWEAYLIDLDKVNQELAKGVTGTERESLLRTKAEYERVLNMRQNPNGAGTGKAAFSTSDWGFISPKTGKTVKMPKSRATETHTALARELGFPSENAAIDAGYIRYGVWGRGGSFTKPTLYIQASHIASAHYILELLSRVMGKYGKDTEVVIDVPYYTRQVGQYMPIGDVLRDFMAIARVRNPNHPWPETAVDIAGSFLLPGVRQAVEVYSRNPMNWEDSFWGMYDSEKGKFYYPKPGERHHVKMAQRLGFKSSIDAVDYHGFVRFSTEDDSLLVELKGIDKRGWAVVNVLREVMRRHKGPIHNVTVDDWTRYSNSFDSIDEAIKSISTMESNPVGVATSPGEVNPMHAESFWGFFDPKTGKYYWPRAYDRIHHDLAQRLGYDDAHAAIKTGLVRFSVDKDEAVVHVRSLSKQGWAAVEVLHKMQSNWNGPVTDVLVMEDGSPTPSVYGSFNEALNAVGTLEVD